MTMKSVGIATLNPGAPDETWGKCRNLEVTPEGDKEPIKDGAGDTVGVLYTDIRRKLTGEYTPLVEAGSTISDGTEMVGKTLSVNGVSALIDTASMRRESGKAATYKIEGYVYPNLSNNGGGGGGGNGGAGGGGDGE